MAILNNAQMAASIATIDDGGLNTAAEVRSVLIDLADSLFPLVGIIEDGNVPGISITSTPTKITSFTTDLSLENDLYKPEQVNGRVLVKASGVHLATMNFNGMWAATEDLVIEVYLNGNPTGILLSQSGAGVADPQAMLISLRTMFIFAADIGAVDPGVAIVELFHYSTSGPFTLEQLDINLAVIYENGTIDAIG